jgi:hypothetical protein
MEDVTWEPPVLRFAVERHGRTVAGSTRADLQNMGMDIYRSQGFDHVADHAYDLAECLVKFGAYYDSEPVLWVPKRSLVDAMKDQDFGEAIATAFGADLEALEDEDEEMTYYLWY